MMSDHHHHHHHQLVATAADVMRVFPEGRPDEGARWIIRLLRQLHVIDNMIMTDTALGYYYLWRMQLGSSSSSSSDVLLMATTCVFLAYKVEGERTLYGLSISRLRRALSDVLQCLPDEGRRVSVPTRQAIIEAEAALLANVLHFLFAIDLPYGYVPPLAARLGLGLSAATIGEHAVGIINDSCRDTLVALFFPARCIAHAALLLAARACNITAVATAAEDDDTTSLLLPQCIDYLYAYVSGSAASV